MEDKYIAKVSILKYGNIFFLSIAFCWLILPLLIILCLYLKVKKEKYVFNGLKYEIHKGNYNNNVVERQITEIYTISVEKSLLGKIFNYGNVFCKTSQNMGNAFDFVKDPEKLKEYLEAQNNKAKLNLL